jgi:hypothetical protein
MLTMTKGSLDCPASLQLPRQAPPVGRALRILLGLVLMVYVTPVYFRVPMGLAVGACLLVLGLIGVYGLIHICIATNHCLWPLPWGRSGAGVARRVVCCGRFRVTDPWPRKGSARSSYLSRCLVGGCWRARRSRLRGDGNP